MVFPPIDKGGGNRVFFIGLSEHSAVSISPGRFFETKSGIFVKSLGRKSNNPTAKKTHFSLTSVWRARARRRGCVAGS
jgi:hypothetical protein